MSTLLQRVVELLEASGLPHALIGAAALAAAGVSRSTFDIDLLVTDRRTLKDSLWETLRGAGAHVEVRRGDFDDPLAGVVRVEMGGERPVDLVVGRHPWQARAIERAIPGHPPVVTPRDLVLLKLFAGGRQDLWDVRELLALPDGERLAAEVVVDLAELPAELTARWREARG